MRASVVIPARDRSSSLRLTLACLAVQDRTDDVEFVVVDDGSVDDTRAVVTDPVWCDRFRLVAESGRGRASARNAGARAAIGEYLLFVDADVLVPKCFVSAHLAAHRGHGVRAVDPTDPGPVTLVHGPVRELPRARNLLDDQPADPYQAAAQRVYGRSVRSALERMVASMVDGDVPAVAPWLACVGANISLPRAVWAEAGGFDESFGTGWGCEDLEFGFRLASLGTRFGVAAGADGIHLTHVRPGRWAEHQQSHELFATRHPDPTVRALDSLLSGDGDTRRYVARVAELRAADRS